MHAAGMIANKQRYSILEGDCKELVEDILRFTLMQSCLQMCNLLSVCLI